MSVLTHNSTCRSWTFPVSCWDCGQRIYIFHCTCGSSVRFNKLGTPWPQHDCSGERLPTGWEAIRKLQALGVTVDKAILEYAFGKRQSKKQTPPPIVKVEPELGTTINCILVLREVESDTKALNELQKLGEIGLKMLGLSNTKKLAQLTFHDMSQKQAKSYTCYISEEYRPSKPDIGKLFGITLTGYHAGSFKFWLASGIAYLGIEQ